KRSRCELSRSVPGDGEFGRGSAPAPGARAGNRNLHLRACRAQAAGNEDGQRRRVTRARGNSRKLDVVEAEFGFACAREVESGGNRATARIASAGAALDEGREGRSHGGSVPTRDRQVLNERAGATRGKTCWAEIRPCAGTCGSCARRPRTLPR